MKKQLSKGILFLLILSIVITPALTNDVTQRTVGPQASYQLSQYSVALGNLKCGTMEVSFSVFGTHNLNGVRQGQPRL